MGGSALGSRSQRMKTYIAECEADRVGMWAVIEV
jgi:hypothetical protein